MRSPSRRRSPSRFCTWGRDMAFNLSLEVTELISHAKQQAHTHLVAGGLPAAVADELIKKALADLAGYRGDEKLAHARAQLAALCKPVLGAVSAITPSFAPEMWGTR